MVLAVRRATTTAFRLGRGVRIGRTRRFRSLRAHRLSQRCHEYKIVLERPDTGPKHAALLKYGAARSPDICGRWCFLLFGLLARIGEHDEVSKVREPRVLSEGGPIIDR